ILYIHFYYRTVSIKFILYSSSNGKVLFKIGKNLLSDDFGETLKKVISTFKKSVTEWVKSGKSEFAIKDSKEFTDLITQNAREVFVNKTSQLDTADVVINKQQWLEGEILSTIFKERWFAFIKTS